MKTRDRYGEKERPSTEEQRRQRELHRCQSRAPELTTPWSLGTNAQCIKKAGHEGRHKIGYSGGFTFTWD